MKNNHRRGSVLWSLAGCGLFPAYIVISWRCLSVALCHSKHSLGSHEYVQNCRKWESEIRLQLLSQSTMRRDLGRRVSPCGPRHPSIFHCWIFHDIDFLFYFCCCFSGVIIYFFNTECMHSTFSGFECCGKTMHRHRCPQIFYSGPWDCSCIYAWMSIMKRMKVWIVICDYQGIMYFILYPLLCAVREHICTFFNVTEISSFTLFIKHF